MPHQVGEQASAKVDDDVFRANKVIKLDPDESVARIKFGDRIKMNVAQFEKLTKAFFAELEAKFL